MKKLVKLIQNVINKMIDVILFGSKSCDNCKDWLDIINKLGYNNYFVDVYSNNSDDIEFMLTYNPKTIPTVVFYKGRNRKYFLGSAPHIDVVKYEINKWMRVMNNDKLC